MSFYNKKKTFSRKVSKKGSLKKVKRSKNLSKRKSLKRKRMRRKMSLKNKRKIRKRLKGGKLNPLVPLPLRDLGDLMRGSIEHTSDIYNGTDYAIETSPVDGHFQHNNY